MDMLGVLILMNWLLRIVKRSELKVSNSLLAEAPCHKLASVGVSCPLPEPQVGPRGYNEDVQHFDARSYTRPHGPGRKRVLEIHTLHARAANMR